MKIKPTQKLACLAAIVFFLAFTFPLHATSAADLAAEAQALEQADPTPASEVSSGGTYYSAALINKAGAAGLLPYPTSLNYPAWPLGGNVWLLDDLQTSTSATSEGMRAMDDSGPPIPQGGGGTNTLEPDYGLPAFTTNELWLQILSVTNDTADLVIHPPWNVTNGVYDLHYCTNLASPTAWQWLLRTDPRQTNLAISNAIGPQGFYRLGLPDDLTANDSLGTNFWLAFPNMSGGESPDLSLYISGPVATTGMVAVASETNGPVLIVSGCGDTNVNGTYLFTNNLSPAQSEFGFDTAYLKGDLEIGLAGYWQIIDSSSETTLYFTSDGSLNLNRSDWIANDDVDPPPVTACPATYFTLPFSVTPSQVTNVAIPSWVMVTDNDVAEYQGINVTASQPVSVCAVNFVVAASATFNAYPTTLLGTNYCVMAYTGLGGGYNSQFAIVATTNNTTVTITPTATESLEDGTTNYTVTLQQGETFQDYDRNNDGGDVTGTLITSDQPIGVFAGANIAEVPNGIQSANPLVQEQLPVDLWGTQTLALSFAGRIGGDTYRILAANDDTVVFTNGVVAGTNQAGQFLEMVIDGPVEFQASQPVQVAQFANGSTFNNNPSPEGDPCEILLPPTGHYLETNTVFSLPNDNINGDFDENYLNIIVLQSAIAGTLVDGSPVAATNFVAIGTSGYYGAQIVVTNVGAHTVTSPQPVEVEAYGFGNAVSEEQDAYGYLGGVVK